MTSNTLIWSTSSASMRTYHINETMTQKTMEVRSVDVKVRIE